MQTLKQTQITVMDLPVVELEGVVFKFVRKYSAFLHDEKGNPKYMKVPLDKASIEKMIKEAKNELTDSEIRDILELIYVLLDSGVPKEEIWLETAYDSKSNVDDQQPITLTKTRIRPIKNSTIEPIEHSTIKIGETLFQFLVNYSGFLYNDEGHAKYMKLSPTEINFSEMEKDAEQEIGKEKINKLIELMFIILKYQAHVKEELWFEID